MNHTPEEIQIALEVLVIWTAWTRAQSCLKFSIPGMVLFPIIRTLALIAHITDSTPENAIVQHSIYSYVSKFHNQSLPSTAATFITPAIFFSGCLQVEVIVNSTTTTNTDVVTIPIGTSTGPFFHYSTCLPAISTTNRTPNSLSSDVNRLLFSMASTECTFRLLFLFWADRPHFHPPSDLICGMAADSQVVMSKKGGDSCPLR